MKILFITNLSDKFSGFRNIRDVSKDFNVSGLGLEYPLSLLEELSKYMVVDVYSPPLDHVISTTPLDAYTQAKNQVTFRPTTVAVPVTVSLNQILLGKTYDVVLVYAEAMFTYISDWRHIGKIVLWFLSSPHQILLPQYEQFFRDDSDKVDLVLTVVDKAGTTEFGKKFRRLGLKTAWLPLSVDGNRFRNMHLEKSIDICLLGNLNPMVYPLRLQATNYLIMQRNYNLMLLPQYGEEYVKTINRSKVFLTCSGNFMFPVMKYFEAMACGTLLFADEPIDMVDLGFSPTENFVSLSKVWSPKVENPTFPVNPDEWRFDGDVLKRLVDYYFTHVVEANAVSLGGERLVQKSHTHIVRAKELASLLNMKLF